MVKDSKMNPEVQNGAKETLKDVISALKDKDIQNYIIVGGWCPYLRSQDQKDITHPGTVDVDILVQDKGKNVLEMLLIFIWRLN